MPAVWAVDLVSDLGQVLVVVVVVVVAIDAIKVKGVYSVKMLVKERTEEGYEMTRFTY